MITLWKIIANPFRWSWRLLIFIREFILNIFVVLLIVIVVSIYLQITHTTPSMTTGALVMDLTGIIVDKSAMKNKFRLLGRELLGTASNRIQENSLFDVVEILRQAKNNTHITGLVLSLKNFYGADQASLQYIGKALREFRDSGKPIYAIGESYSQAQYFLASYANKIYLMPHGMVDLHGFATHNFYYKSLLDKLKVNSYIFRVGKYKSAAEPFLRDNMSKAARDADSRWVGQLWQHYLDIVAGNRQVTPQQFFPRFPTLLAGLRAVNGDTAQFALQNKWVDEVASRSTIDKAMTQAFGWNEQSQSFNATSIYDYQQIYTSQQSAAQSAQSAQSAQIAVIFANGAITDGPEKPGSMSSDTTALQIRDARLNPNIKAIVFRVNSPGGSVSASEIIRSELVAVRDANKPIVISMGGMAASGGYWISTPGNMIIASPSTITGSIGIFGIIHTIENLLDRIGVHTDGVTTSPIAGMSITQKLPVEFSQIMQLNVENGYKKFITLVAESRNKTMDEIEKIAQGHVWIGSDAINKGLVDKLGDFDDAVNKAAELANIEQYQLNWYLNEPNFMNMLLTQINAAVLAVLPNTISEIAQLMNKDAALGFVDPQNCYALCINCDKDGNKIHSN
ncbi:signal peptide peptidase SppA [Candidatus Palibaumannia cicadellinicola]|uniref:Protease IV signal peptide peptidase SppA, 67K type n=1 Tax=Candidatus Palibaumannia cicadellinicola TaxID=186490 RepID=A0A088MYK6_9GAMM|nr:signal peptide peptidase SppA [Candidatus Baumannia cicadellinicola]AIN47362.1 Protease IV; signal peptide peptidase SppA, 67K type [Candidatus Baumannia cicadellinicola]